MPQPQIVLVLSLQLIVTRGALIHHVKKKDS